MTISPDIPSLVAALQGADDEALFKEANQVRARFVGDTVYLRGIIEFSNCCANHCWYCGIRGDNTHLPRYRMTPDEILETARIAKNWRCGTIVLQSGEDPFFTAELLGRIIRRLKTELDLAVTLSVGVRSREDLVVLKAAGCDRYLLRFETTDEALFATIHPDHAFARRIQCLTDLREAGYQVGSGFMIGLPGASLEQIAKDILFTTRLDLDMIGCGPFLSHPDTPLASQPVLADRNIYYRTIALLRILNPKSHIPATTAFDALEYHGRDRVLDCGANIFMPNISPEKNRKLYQLYPNKPAVDEEGETSIRRVCDRLAALGRPIGIGAGHSLKTAF